MDNLYLTLKNHANLEDRIVKHQTRAFSSIKTSTNLHHIFKIVCRRLSILVHFKENYCARQCTYMHKTILYSFLGDQTLSYRFCGFFILESVSAYAVGGAGTELIKDQIR